MTSGGFLTGGILGAGLYAWWMKQKPKVLLRLPKKWPLVARVLLSSEELQVLYWMQRTFPEHLVMVKLPVLRFTALTSTEKMSSTPRWQQLLEGVYCIFTVCSTSGLVVGCVDVIGKSGLSKRNRDMKESLLSDCNIAYCVVQGDKLPSVGGIRAAFLGELEIQDQKEHQETRGVDTLFHAELIDFPKQKNSIKADGLKANSLKVDSQVIT